MNAQTITWAQQISFKEFLFKNKKTLWLAVIAIIVQISIFKYSYPYASYIHADSFSYIQAAHENSDINTYMIGYSRFLRIFSAISNSDTLLVIFQFFVIHASVLAFLLTVFYFYKTSRITQYISLCFAILNPLFLYLANLISSDCLFTALSFIWFTTLLWMINRSSSIIISLNSLCLFFAFTIRYNALIYPFILVCALLIARASLRKKIIGLSFTVFICTFFVFYTGKQYKKVTGHWQYSPFSGWQLANNAMYAYRYVNSVDRQPVPIEFENLDNMVRAYFDSTRDLRKFPVETLQANTVYMWDQRISPLYKYRDKLFIGDSTSTEFRRWASMGPLYKKYGLLIINKYPKYFLKHFIGPNTIKYFAPPVEFLQTYNSGLDTVLSNAQMWFDYSSRKVKYRVKDKKVNTLDFYPVLSGIINIVMVSVLICFVLLKGWTLDKNFAKAILLGSCTWILNAAFTIFASSAALRFQSFPILLTTFFSILLMEWMIKLALLQKESHIDKWNQGALSPNNLAHNPSSI